MTTLRITALLFCSIVLSSLTGCDTNNATANNAPPIVALFDPVTGNMPLTNDLLFQGSTDGTLNIPISDATDDGQRALITSLNTLDGFGLTAPSTIGFDGAVSASSTVVGSSVRLFELTQDSTGSTTGITRELPGNEMAAGVTASTPNALTLTPLKPLKESTRYLVILTDKIRSTEGGKASASPTYALTKGNTALTGSNAPLEPLRQLTNQLENLAATQGIAKDSIILSWTFTTLSVSPSLQAAATLAPTNTIQLSPTIGTTKQISNQLRGAADVHVGALNVPYYLEAPSAANPLAALNGFWKGANGSLLTRYNPSPSPTETQTIPLLLTVPNANAMTATTPANGWPVVIFQHGITRNREDLLALADTLADAGFAAISIDLPLHGVTTATDPLKTDNTAFDDGEERTFNLDLANNTTGTAGADGSIDNSGTHFINLNSLLTSRDNIRQGVSDLLTLRKSLASITSVPLNTSHVGFIGHSLGGIVGSVYLGAETLPTPASLVTTGGGIARLLDGSPSFGPSIHAGLANAGLMQGTSSYDAFMSSAQTILDAADPIDWGEKAAQTHPLHMIEVVGINGVGSDQVIPNRVTGAPLSGTEPLVSRMRLKTVAQTTGGSDGIVRFTSGVHGSILDPTASFDATAEMQFEVAAFQSAQGNSITVNNTSLLTTTVP
jgi:pimeloyl-ACP methyl ester carboxylesterase